MNASRLNRVIQGMTKYGLPCILVSDIESIYYLTGRWIQPGERMVALTVTAGGEACLFANRLFAQSPEADLPLVEYDDTEDCVAILSAHLPESLDVIGIDKRWPSHFLIRLMERRPGLRVKVGSAPVDEARMVKDAEEIAAMRESSRLNDRVLEALMKTGRPRKVHVCCVIATPEGIDVVREALPDGSTIWCAAIDPGMNEHKYIVPGFGDCGDLCYGEEL